MCIRDSTNVAQQEHEDGNHARMSVLYARAMLAYHYTLAAIGKHMHNLEDGEQSTNRSCKTGPECHRNAYTGTLSADARLAAHPTRSLGVI